MTEEKMKALEAFKLQYFYSKHISLKNYIKFNNLTLPYNADVEELLHWNSEKRQFLRKQIESVTGLHQSYISTLMERLDLLAGLQDKLVEQMQATTDVRDMKVISQSLQAVVAMYDEAVSKLNIDTIIDNAYENNKLKTDDLLLEDSDDLEFDQD